MQQFFSQVPLQIGREYQFDRAQAHHAGTVLRLNHETVRLVYQGHGYYADGYPVPGGFAAMVLQEDPISRELPSAATICVALIRREWFELVLQKLTELGAARIVPFESSRCVVRAREERSAKQMERWQAIVREAAEQCKRDLIPEVVQTASFRDLASYRSEINAAAYEKAGSESGMLSDLLTGGPCTVVIGPEGGFSEAEVSQLSDMGFQAVSLGRRILRAETASLYAMSVIAEQGEKRRNQ